MNLAPTSARNFSPERFAADLVRAGVAPEKANELAAVEFLLRQIPPEVGSDFIHRCLKRLKSLHPGRRLFTINDLTAEELEKVATGLEAKLPTDDHDFSQLLAEIKTRSLQLGVKISSEYLNRVLDSQLEEIYELLLNTGKR